MCGQKGQRTCRVSICIYHLVYNFMYNFMFIYNLMKDGAGMSGRVVKRRDDVRVECRYVYISLCITLCITLC